MHLLCTQIAPLHPHSTHVWQGDLLSALQGGCATLRHLPCNLLIVKLCARHPHAGETFRGL